MDLLSDDSDEGSSSRAQASSLPTKSRRELLSSLVSREKSLRRPKPAADLESEDDDGFGTFKGYAKSRQVDAKRRDKLRSALLRMSDSEVASASGGGITNLENRENVQHYDMELLRRLDVDAFNDISARVSGLCTKLLSCPDFKTITKVFAFGSKDFTAFGLDQLQLWMPRDFANGANNNTDSAGAGLSAVVESIGQDGTVVTIDQPNLFVNAYKISDKDRKLMLSDSVDTNEFGGRRRKEDLSITTITPEDVEWSEVEKAMRLAGMDYSSTGQRKKWYAIHIIKRHTADNEVPAFLLMGESVVTTNTMGMSNKLVHSSPYHVKSMYINECMGKLTATLSLKMSQLHILDKEEAHRVKVNSIQSLYNFEYQMRIHGENLQDAKDVEELSRTVSQGLYELLDLPDNIKAAVKCYAILPSHAVLPLEYGKELSTGDLVSSCHSMSDLYRIYSGHQEGNLSSTQKTLFSSSISASTSSLNKIFSRSAQNAFISSIDGADLVKHGLLAIDTNDGMEVENDGSSYGQMLTITLSVPLYHRKRLVSIDSESDDLSSVEFYETHLNLLIAVPMSVRISQEKLLRNINDMAIGAGKALDRLKSMEREAVIAQMNAVPKTYLSLDYGNTLDISNKDSAIALPTLLQSLQSPSIAHNVFSAQGTAVWLTDGFVASLEMCASPDIDSDRVSFYHCLNSTDDSNMRVENIQPGDRAFGLTSMSWLRELVEGKLVRYDRAEYSELEIKQSLARYRASGASHVDSWINLHLLVQKTNKDVQSAVLIPVHHHTGLCVVLAIDSLRTHYSHPLAETEGGDASSLDDSIVTMYSTLSQQELCGAYHNGNIASTMDAVFGLVHNIHKSQMVLIDQRKTINRKQASSAVADSQKRKLQKSLVMKEWKYENLKQKKAIADRLLETSVDVMNSIKDTEMLNSTVKKTKKDINDSSSESGSEGEEEEAYNREETVMMSYLGTLETKFSQMFVEDSVQVSFGPRGIPSHVLDQMEVDGKDVLVASTGDSNSDSAKALLFGLIRHESIVASVRVMKTANLPKTFSVDEMYEFSQTVRMASTFFRALKIGVDNPLRTGNVKALLLPFLHQILPLLFSQQEAQGVTSLKTCLQMLAIIYKHLCGGDVAILRIAKNAFAHFDDDSKESYADMYISSEDAAEDFPLSSLFKHNSAGLEAHVVDKSRGVDDDDDEEKGDDSFAQLILSFVDPVSKNSLGEVKVMGPQDGGTFESHQYEAAKLISFVVSNIMSITAKYRHLRQIGVQAHGVGVELRKLFEDSQRQVLIEKEAGKTVWSRYNASMSLLMFHGQLSELRSISQISTFLYESLSKVLFCKNTMLLLHQRFLSAVNDDDTTENVSNADMSEEGLRVIIPSPDNAELSDTFVSYTQLSRIPAYEDYSASTKQCKILLYGGDSAIPMGALLISFDVDDRGEVDDASAASNEEVRPWRGLEDVLSKSLSHCILRAVQNISLAHNAAKLQLDKTTNEAQINTLITDTNRLRDDMEREAEIKAGLVRKNEEIYYELEVALTGKEKAEQEVLLTVERMSNEKEGIVNERDLQYERYLSKIDETEKKVVMYRTEGDASQTHNNKLTSLLDSFAFDARCHKESVVQWLEEYVHNNGCEVLLVSQSVDGTLSPTQGAEDVRGVMSAAGEALRTGNPVEIMSAYAPSGLPPNEVDASVVVSSNNSDKETAAVERRRRWLSLRKDNDRASVLCVPNRCISHHSAHDNAVYVIIRPAGDANDAYPLFDKEYYRCAVGLCARALLRASSRYSFDDMKTMELELAKEKAAVSKLRHAAWISEALHRKQCDTPAAFVKEMEICIRSLLSRGINDSCMVDCFVWLVPTSLANTATIDVSNVYGALENRVRNTAGDIEAAQLVLQSERSYRKAGMLWTPLKTSTGKIFAIVRSERKLDTDINRNATPQQKETIGQPTVSDILITEEEQESVTVFCAQATAHHHRIENILDAMKSMEEASNAIDVLKNSKTVLEGELSLESSVKSQFEKTLQCGTDLLATASAKRVSADQLIESARRSIVALTQSVDAYIIMPEIESVFPKADFASYISRKGKTGKEEKEKTKGKSTTYYTIESDRGAIVSVELQDGDLEQAALSTYRVLSVGEGSKDSKTSATIDTNDANETNNETTVDFQHSHVSMSWAVRRLYSRSTDVHGDVSGMCACSLPFTLLETVNPFGAIHDSNDAVYIHEPSLSENAVITLIKKGHEYTSIDKACTAWLMKVLTYCLQMWIGKGSVFEANGKLEAMNTEMVRLQDLNRDSARFEVDLNAFQQDLCRGVGVTHFPAGTSTSVDASMPLSVDTATTVRESAVDSSANVKERKVVKKLFSDEIVEEQKETAAPITTIIGNNHDNNNNSEIEGDGEEVVLQTATDVFVELEVSLETPSSAGVTIGGILPMNSPESDASTSEEKEEAMMEQMKGTAHRGSIKSSYAEASYWIGMNYDESNRSRVVVVILLSHSDYPTVWFSVRSRAGKPMGSFTDARQVALRLAMLMKLLDAQALWRRQLFESKEEVASLRERASQLNQQLTTVTDTHSKDLEEYSQTCDASIKRNLDAFTVIERALNTTLAISQALVKTALRRGFSFRKPVASIEDVVEVGGDNLTRDMEANDEGDDGTVGNDRGEAGQGEDGIHEIASLGDNDNSPVLDLGAWYVQQLSLICANMCSTTGWDWYHGLISFPNARDPNEVVGMSLMFNEAQSALTWSFSTSEVEVMDLDIAALSNTSDYNSKPLILIVGYNSGYIAAEADEESSDNMNSIEYKVTEYIKSGMTRAYDMMQASNAHLSTAEEPAHLTSMHSTFKVLPKFSTVYECGTILLPLLGHMVVIRPPTGLRTKNISVTQVQDSHFKELYAASMMAMLVCCYNIHSVTLQALSSSQSISDTCVENNSLQTDLEHTHTSLRHTQSSERAYQVQCNTLESKLSKSVDQVKRLKDFQMQCHRYEVGLADWADMVRGVNRCSTNLSNGVKGLWSQASKVLMSLVSSHVTLRGCGLCVLKQVYPSDDNNKKGNSKSNEKEKEDVMGLEYSCRGYDGSDILSFADEYEMDQIVTVRPLSELGSAVENIIKDLLQADTFYTSNRAVYRLTQASKNRESDMEEQIWLVPVRTSRSSHAVIRVNVVINVSQQVAEGAKEGALAGSTSANTHMNVHSTPPTSTRPHSYASTGGKQKIRFTPDTKMTPSKTEAVTPVNIGAVSSTRSDAESIVSKLSFDGSFGKSVGNSTVTSSISHLLDVNAEAIDSAQTNLLNFAEILAPLLLSAQSLDGSKADNIMIQEVVEKQTAITKRLSENLFVSTRSMTLFSKAMNTVGEFQSKLKALKSDFKDGSVTNTGLISDLSDAADSSLLLTRHKLPLGYLAERLSEVLGGSVNIILKDCKEFDVEEGDSAFGSAQGNPGSGTLITETISDGEVTLGRLSVSVAVDDFEANIREFIQSKMDELNIDPLKYPALQSTVESSKETNATYSKDAQAARDAHINTISEMAKPLCYALAGAIKSCARVRLCLKQFPILHKNIESLESTLTEERDKLQLESEKELRSAGLAKHYSSLTSIFNQCVAYLGQVNMNNALGGISSHAVPTDNNIAGGIGGGSSPGGSHDVAMMGTAHVQPMADLNQMLPLLCARLPKLLGVECEFSVAVFKESLHMELDPAKAAANRMSDRHVNVHLDWYYSTEIEPLSTSLHMTQSNRSIADNLARACVTRRLKSVIDIGKSDIDNSMSSSSDGSESQGLRVLSYPLIVSTSESAVGVLQMSLDKAQTLMGGADGVSDAGLEGGLTDEFCQLAANAVACVVYHDQYSKILSTRLFETEESLSQSAVKADELDMFMNMWQKRADAWCGVATAASAILRHSTGGTIALSDIMNSEAVAGPLRGTGVTLALLKGEMDENTGLSKRVDVDKSNFEKGRAAADVVSLTEGDDVVVQISCATSSTTLDNSKVKESSASVSQYLDTEMSIASIAPDLVNALGTIVRSTAVQQKSKQIEVNELKKQHLKMSEKATSLESQLQDKEQELKQVVTTTEVDVAKYIERMQECEKLSHIAASSMSSFCGPTIREVAVMLEELSTERRPQILSAGDAAKSDAMDWAWEGIARIADRAMSRISEGSFGYHTSILVRQPNSKPLRNNDRDTGLDTDLHVKIYDMSRRKDTLVITNNRGPKAAKVGIIADPSASSVEKALLAGGVFENKNSLSHVDLIGIEKQILHSIFDSAEAKSKVHVIVISLPDAPPGVNAVLRIVFPSEVVPSTDKDIDAGGKSGLEDTQLNADKDQAIVGPRSLAKHVLEMTMSLACAVIHICTHLSQQDRKVKAAQEQLRIAVEDKENAEENIDKAKHMHRVVIREACALLDPPLVGPAGQAPKAIHPASLTPLAASQDACMKILTMARTLLGGHGQALLLRDTTTDPPSFQVIYSGDVLSYPGVEQGSFGNASSGDETSLAQACMHSHKVVTVDDCTDDPRFNASLDGNCASGTPMLLVPLRGRGSAVIGVLLVARGRNGMAFNKDDIASAELAVSHGALSLYWCQGLGALHHILNKNINRLQELESAVVGLTR